MAARLSPPSDHVSDPLRFLFLKAPIPITGAIPRSSYVSDTLRFLLLKASILIIGKTPLTACLFGDVTQGMLSLFLKYHGPVIGILLIVSLSHLAPMRDSHSLDYRRSPVRVIDTPLILLLMVSYLK